FIYSGGLLVTFTLNCPVIAFMGQSNQVNSRIATTQIESAWEFVPHPNVLEFGRIFRVSLQIGLHQPFKSVAFVSLGEGNCSVFVYFLLKANFLFWFFCS